MRYTTTLLAACLLLAGAAVGCSGDASDTAESKGASKPPSTSTPAVEESATSAEDALKEAEEEFEQSLKDIEDSLGETIGIQEGTYEVTDSSPEYDDPSLALDDEYIAPGTYTTKGPADPSYDCYWTRMKDASGQSILANDLTAGRAIVALEEGEFFKTSGCKPWTRSGD